MRRLALFALLCAVPACGDDSSGDRLPLPSGMAPGATPAAPETPAPAAPAATTTTAGARPGAVPVMPGGPLDPAKEATLAEVRKRPFKNEEFTESGSNRDPFRSYLADYATTTTVTAQYKIELAKYTLEELKLVAIVGPPTGTRRAAPVATAGSGYTQWRAMFVDPKGTGVMVGRGEHISRADAKITRITGDRVYLELREDLGAGKTRLIERVLELHAGEPAAEEP